MIGSWDDEERTSALVLLGLVTAVVGGLGGFELFHGRGLLLGNLGIGVVPLLAALGLVLLVLARRDGGGWPPVAAGGCALLAVAGALAARTPAPAQLAGPALLGTFLLARASFLWWRASVRRPVHDPDARIRAIGLWLLLAGLAATPLAALRLAVIVLVLYWVRDLLVRFLAALEPWWLRLWTPREHALEPGPDEAFREEVEADAGHDPFAADKERIRQFIDVNYRTGMGSRWPSVEFEPSVDSGGFTVHILVKPDNIDAEDFIKRADNLATALRIDEGRLSIRLSGKRQAWLIEITKTATDLRPVWFDDIHPRIQATIAAERLPSTAFLVGLDPFEELVMARLDDGENPHTLFAGTTGSGKSVWIHSVLVQLLLQNSPRDLRLLFADAGYSTQDEYARVKHLWRPIASDLSTMATYIEELVAERDRRLLLFKDSGSGVVDRRSYLHKFPDAELPLIVLVVDEAATFVTSANDDVKEKYQRGVRELLQNGRKSGIHLLIGLQRPMVDTLGKGVRELTGRRIMFRVEEATHSETMMSKGDTIGTRLRGRGDGLLREGPRRERFQSVYLPDKEIEASDKGGRTHQWLADYVARIIELYGEGTGEDAYVPAADAHAASLTKQRVAGAHKAGLTDLEWLVIEALRLQVAGDAESDTYHEHHVTGTTLLPFFERAAGDYPFLRPPRAPDLEDALRKIVGPATRTGEWIIAGRATVEGTRFNPGFVGRWAAEGTVSPKGAPRRRSIEDLERLPDRDP